MSYSDKQDRRRKFQLALVGIVVTLYILAPFSWMVLSSFVPEQDALAVPPNWIPKNPTLENYRAFIDPSDRRALVGSRAAEQTLPAMLNSFIVATCTALLNVTLGVLGGYSLARLSFRGRDQLLMFYLASRMLPGIALIIPMYLLIRSLGLLDTLVALVMTYLTFTLPFTIWLLKNYLQAIPRSLEEAALIDGCNWGQMMRNILLPAAAPGLVAAAMFAFMTAWSDYLFAVILTSSIAAKTIPVVVAGFATDVTTERTMLAAAGVLAVVPPLILAFIFQKLIVQGLTSGAVKD
ncbi:carbohydrate ABC transporter permease [Leptospira interrogans]